MPVFGSDFSSPEQTHLGKGSAAQWSVETEVLFPPIFRAEYAAQARALLWLVRVRRTAARQRRIDYLDGWFGVVDRAVAATRGYFRHPAF